jgi:ComF family protein
MQVKHLSVVKITMIDKALSLFFPHICKGCGASGAPLCERCVFDLLKTRSSVNRHNLYAVGQRRGALKRLVDDYKFKNERTTAKILARLLDESLPKLPPKTVIVPVPTAAQRIRQRGFDHVALIAKYLARRRGLNYRLILARKTNTTQHFSKTAQARARAAQAAFYLPRPQAPAQVLLLDDIHTTGATLRAARSLLIKNGAKSVRLAAVCYQDNSKTTN